jgi:hypothetical protein
LKNIHYNKLRLNKFLITFLSKENSIIVSCSKLMQHRIIRLMENHKNMN